LRKTIVNHINKNYTLYCFIRKTYFSSCYLYLSR